MPRRKPLKSFVVPVEYTVRCSVVVAAVDAEAAKDSNTILQVLECPPSGEITDWRATGPAVDND